MVAQLEVQNREKEIRDIIEDSKEAQFDALMQDIKKENIKPTEVADAFNDHGKEVLNIIKDDFDKSKADTYKLANEAFKTDINTVKENLKPTEKKKEKKTLSFPSDVIYDKKNEKKSKPEKPSEPSPVDNLDTLLAITNDIDKLISKEAEVKTEKEYLLNQNKTTEASTNFFEGNMENYNSIMNDVFDEGKEKKDDKLTITKNSKGKAYQVYQWVSAYTGISESDLSEIKLAKASNTYANRFPKDERVIEYKIPIKNDKNEITGYEDKPKYLVRGTHEQMQQRIAKNRMENKAGIKIQDIDRTKTYRRSEDGIISEPNGTKPEKTIEVKASLNIFDDIGNFQAFKMYIENKKSAYIGQNIGEIVAQIKDYKPSIDTGDGIDYQGNNVSIPKNGYANVLTNFIVENFNDTALLEIYLTYLTKDNLDILGVDKTTRIVNYNKLVPGIKNIRDKLDPAEQKRLIELGNTIGAQEKMTPQEMISKGLDGLMNAFGPMLFSILKMFGISKKSLIKMFPGSKDKINEIFTKEYGLSEDQITAIGTISQNEEFSKEDKLLMTGSKMKDEFKDKKNEYLELIAEDKNSKLINVNVFQKGLNLYNKDQNTSININDIVTIETDPKTKKQSITKINNIDKFKLVIKSILEDNTIRSKIAGANDEIITPTEAKKKKGNEYNDLFDKIDEAQSYAIMNQQDIARYITASLFSDKDLSSVIMENQLNNGNLEVIMPTPKKYTVANDSNLRSTITINQPTIIEEVKKDKVVTEILDNKNQQQKNTAKGLGLTAADFPEGEKDRESKEYIIVRTDTNKEGWILLSNITDQPKENTDKPVETPEQKFTKNRELISGDKKINNDKKLYGTFDFTKFTYNKEAKLDQQEYQTNILESFERILTDKEQYPLRVEKCNDNKTIYEGRLPIHLANVLNTIDEKNKTTQYKEAITELLKIGDKYTITADQKLNTITIESRTGEKTNGKIILSQIDGKLEAKIIK